MLYNSIRRDSFIDTIITQARFMTSRQKTFAKKIAKNLPRKHTVSTWEISEEFLSLSMADSKKFYHFLYDLYAIHCAVPLTVYKLEKAHFLRRVKDSERKGSFGKIMKQEDFVASVNILQAEEKVDLICLAYALLASGARGVDLTRIQKVSVLSQTKVSALIPFDKTNTNFKTIEFDYDVFDDSWLTPGITRGLLSAWLASSQVVNSQLKQLRDVAYFRPHELRATKAVLMIIKGCNKIGVMEAIGWKSECSLLRYIKSDFNLIARCKSYQEVEALINSH